MDYELKCANLNARLRKSMIAPMLLIALCVTSCKTTQLSQSTANAQQIEQKTDLEQQTHSEEQTQVSKQSSDLSTSNMEVDETIEETTWSEPDSTGAQYPVKTTTTKRTTHSGKQNNIQSSVNRSANMVEDINTNDNSKQTISTNEQTNTEQTTKVKTPSWVIVLIVGIILIVLIVILVVLRHYKII